MKGVVRTRVGYAGGRKLDPTYHSIGDHTETIQIDYDPNVIDYADLLDVFWKSHDPTGRTWSTQYKNVLFYHDDEQKKLALESRKSIEAELGETVRTEIVPFQRFYIAEDYHQKHDLQRSLTLMSEFRAMYPDFDDFVDSTAAARVNGYMGGSGNCADLKDEIDDYGLSNDAGEKLLKHVCGGNAVHACPSPIKRSGE